MTVDETTIRQWADKQQCRNRLPILIRRLIRETTPGLRSMRFPGNEAVDLPGLDGRVETDERTNWVPQGASYWEMGCNQDCQTKANDDYTKRTAETPKEVKEKCGFVFVTPRRWNKKEEWLETRRAEADWKAVDAYDAIDLETWLEQAPVTSRWYLELLGRYIPGLLSADEWWNRWSNASNPPLSTRLVLSRKLNESENLIERLRNNEPVIAVQADDRKEAVAFVIAALKNANANDLLDRLLVATVDNIVFPSSDVRLIAITDIGEGAEIEFEDRGNTTIIRPYPRGVHGIHGVMALTHVPSDVMRTELEAMGMSRAEASRVSYRCGHSVPVLRRHLSADPEISRPIWARDRVSAARLLPFVLAGSWSDREEFIDNEIIQLLGEISALDVKGIKNSLLDSEDAPIAFFGEANIVVSQLDAFFAVGPFIDSAFLQRYFELVPELLLERDPALDLPDQHRWMANVLGKGGAYSGALLSGLGDSLCILAIYGQQICGERLHVDIVMRIDGLVRKVMQNADEERWYTIRGCLKTLAEAAPNAFLSCLEANLQVEPASVGALLDVPEGHSNECLYADLLWALETLAWHPEYFERVAKILCELHIFPIKGNWSNSPLSTLRSIFRVWSPSTSMSADKRIEVLRRIFESYRLPSFDVCLSLVRIDGIAMQNATPQWRVLEHDVVSPTRQEVFDSMKMASCLLLDCVPFDQEELALTIDIIPHLHPEDLARFVIEVERFSQTADDAVKADLLQLYRQAEVNLAHQEIDKTPGFTAAMAEMERLLEPVTSTARNRWLFEDSHILWSELVEEGEGRMSWEDQEARIKQRRKDALTEIVDEYGEDGVIEFVFTVKHPATVAWVLLNDENETEFAANWIDKALSTEAENASNKFLNQLLLSASLGDLSGVLGILRDSEKLSDQDKLVRLAEQLPGNEAGWRVAEELGEEFSLVYWKSTTVRCWHDTPPEQVTYAVEKLLEARRPRSAFFAAESSIDNLEPELWVKVLSDIARIDEVGIRLPGEHYLEKVLSFIDESEKVSLQDVASLELPFADLLCSHRIRAKRRTLAIHRKMADDADYFLQLLCWSFRRRNDHDDSGADQLTDDQMRNLAKLSRSVIDDWQVIPGRGGSGEIDKASFNAWAEVVFSRANELDIAAMASIKFGAMLAAEASPLSWDAQPPLPIIDYLERAESESLRRAFEVGEHNARGVTVRSPYDGGGQERILAGQYRKLAAGYVVTHPYVSTMLERIASTYHREAQHEDERAEVGERWRE